MLLLLLLDFRHRYTWCKQTAHIVVAPPTTIPWIVPNENPFVPPTTNREGARFSSDKIDVFRMGHEYTTHSKAAKINFGRTSSATIAGTRNG